MVEQEPYLEGVDSEETSAPERMFISRVVFIVFLFALLCLLVPTFVGDTKGIPSGRWYGGAVILAGVAALIAGRVARHRQVESVIETADSPQIDDTPPSSRSQAANGKIRRARDDMQASMCAAARGFR